MDLVPPGSLSGRLRLIRLAPAFLPAPRSSACDDVNATPMPTFCRHNRLLQNCPICARERSLEPRPLISSPPGRSPGAGASRRSAQRPGGAGHASEPGRRAGGGGVRVRRLAREAEDGYRCELVPGLRSSAQAQRLAAELAFSATRLRRLREHPPGLYAQVADPAIDIEERTWLAFLIAYLGPLEGDDPFGAIEARRTSWASGELPDLSGVATGVRSAHAPERGARTLEAYRAWAQRAGSQRAAFAGEESWSAGRRFARVYERLAIPGMTRDARFELLLCLGTLGVYELVADTLALGGQDETTLGAKRVLGIGEKMLLERRAAELARACGLPLGCLDLALYNWAADQRATGGLGRDSEPDADTLARVREALALEQRPR